MRISSSIILHLHHHRTQPPVSTTCKHHRAGRFPQSSNNLKDTCGQTLMPSAFDCLAVILHLSALGTVSSHASRFFIQSKSMSPCNTRTWNSKQLVFYGCFNWMIPNHYIRNGCFTKHPLKNGCLGFQEHTTRCES